MTEQRSGEHCSDCPRKPGRVFYSGKYLWLSGAMVGIMVRGRIREGSMSVESAEISVLHVIRQLCFTLTGS